MATNKTHKIIEAEHNRPTNNHEFKQARPVGNPTTKRIIAIALWMGGLIFEILAILAFKDKVNFPVADNLWGAILYLVLDLICIVIGSQFWKSANHIAPASSANKTKFWIQNNLGTIIATLAFVPFIIVALTDKKADKKTKTIASVVAIVALLIGGIAGYDFNPISQEQLEEAQQQLGTQTVYWTKGGRVYHTHEDCHALNRSDELYKGTVEQAMAKEDGGSKTSLCSFCYKRDHATATENNDINTSNLPPEIPESK